MATYPIKPAPGRGVGGKRRLPDDNTNTRNKDEDKDEDEDEDEGDCSRVKCSKPKPTRPAVTEQPPTSGNYVELHEYLRCTPNEAKTYLRALVAWAIAEEHPDADYDHDDDEEDDGDDDEEDDEEDDKDDDDNEDDDEDDDEDDKDDEVPWNVHRTINMWLEEHDVDIYPTHWLRRASVHHIMLSHMTGATHPSKSLRPIDYDDIANGDNLFCKELGDFSFSKNDLAFFARFAADGIINNTLKTAAAVRDDLVDAATKSLARKASPRRDCSAWNDVYDAWRDPYMSSNPYAAEYATRVAARVVAELVENTHLFASVASLYVVPTASAAITNLCEAVKTLSEQEDADVDIDELALQHLGRYSYIEHKFIVADEHAPLIAKLRAGLCEQ